MFEINLFMLTILKIILIHIVRKIYLIKFRRIIFKLESISSSQKFIFSY